MKKKRDYIVVGAGLAGIAVAEQLRRRQRSFAVFDNHLPSASTVAAGLCNPVVLKRFTSSWNAETYFPYAVAFYKELESYLDVELYEDLAIYRKFHSVEEQNEWAIASEKPELTKYLQSKIETQSLSYIEAPYHFGKTKNTGRLRVQTMITEYQNRLQKEGQLFSTFEYNDLHYYNEGIQYQEFEAKVIIFCEGIHIQRNPYFSDYPLYGNKGEYLFVESPELQLDVALKANSFCIPESDDHYRIGATYARGDDTAKPTEEARTELETQFRKMTSAPYIIIDQVAGIRPTSPDRRPLVGAHFQAKNTFVLNGLGSRGVVMAPLLAAQLLDRIETGQSLPPEVDCRRFEKRILQKRKG